MRAQILIDNLAQEGLVCEWGFAAHIETEGGKVLLDAGASGAFAQNAETMGVDLAKVDYAVLSHAHFDHSDGLDRFFEKNSSAPLLLREGTAENCYKKVGLAHTKYIGIRKGMLNNHEERIQYVSGKHEVCPGAWLIPHTTPCLSVLGQHAHMYTKHGLMLKPDDFAHEQTLVVEGEKGLVIFNSCSHGGAANIIRETAEAFPGKQLYAYVGGLHLFESTDEEIAAVAQGIRSTGMQRVITGHCTGEHAFQLLQQLLGDGVTQMYSGMTLEF